MEDLVSILDKTVISTLDKKLRDLNYCDMWGLLHGVYKQIVPSVTGKRQTKGEYREFMEQNQPLQRLFATYIAHKLNELGKEHHARHVMPYYGLEGLRVIST